MDNDKVNSVFREIIQTLGQRFPPDRIIDGPRASSLIPTSREALRHIHGLAIAGLELPPEKLEKKMRWLGFMQGVLWCCGVASLERLKEQNMPDAERQADDRPTEWDPRANGWVDQ